MCVWFNALGGDFWPCGEENVFYHYPMDKSREFRGNQGLKTLADMVERELREQEERSQ